MLTWSGTPQHSKAVGARGIYHVQVYGFGYQLTATGHDHLPHMGTPCRYQHIDHARDAAEQLERVYEGEVGGE